MLTQAKMEAGPARAEEMEWKERDLEDIPFIDNFFDVVISIFGHMFAPHP